MEDKKLVITIARSYGSGGLTLAKKLGIELGLPVYDREILRRASDQSGISEELFGEVDECVKKIFMSSKGKYKGIPLTPENSAFTSNDNLFEIQADVIKKIANTESCIFVGRCADYILKDRPYVLSLYFYASEADCLERLRKQVFGTDEELLKRMHEIDKHRSDYYRYYTGKDWNDARNYDFCLDTGVMDYDKLIEVVKSYIEIKNRDM
ncbi:cytidylate kinase-like family protein [Pseudobutyrivibrio sp. MD2005]|uniref:cytidylate kinase-like family protein n=1 Tax=Pseudobutyrivibrio sp. MD2005 TaxID=1410616 RepID=UPI000568C9D9|nr:cytidylate kinase-like family protein [Pseudobutyrivibrio sp. MD2005]